MRNVFLALCAVLIAAHAAMAQTAVLTATSDDLTASGGKVAVTATATYEGQPAALGWSLELPAGWSFESLYGANLPSVAPETGATGTLDFAYVTAPANAAAFSVTLKYPAKAAHATLRGRLVVRQSGRLTSIDAAPLDFARTPPPPVKPQR